MRGRSLAEISNGSVEPLPDFLLSYSYAEGSNERDRDVFYESLIVSGNFLRCAFHFHCWSVIFSAIPDLLRKEIEEFRGVG